MGPQDYQPAVTLILIVARLRGAGGCAAGPVTLRIQVPALIRCSAAEFYFTTKARRHNVTIGFVIEIEILRCARSRRARRGIVVWGIWGKGTLPGKPHYRIARKPGC